MEQLTVEQVIALAKQYAPQAQMRSSADACIADAENCLERAAVDTSYDWNASARMWAVKSLAYSVGVFSPVYKQAKQ